MTVVLRNMIKEDLMGYRYSIPEMRVFEFMSMNDEMSKYEKDSEEYLKIRDEMWTKFAKYSI